MLKRILAKSTWVMGLIVILCTYNMAYANVKVSENLDARSAREPTIKLNDDSATSPSTTDTNTSPVTSNKKKEATLRKPATAVNGCSCSCTAKIGRTTAAAAPGPWWDCVKGCLRSWGVSIVQLVMCGVTCIGGIVPACAICLGISASLIGFCSIGCAVYSAFDNHGDDYEPILTRKMPRKNRLSGERRVLALAARK